MVSMPSTGFYLFLLIVNLEKDKSGGLCQCPQRASTYFFKETNGKTISSNNRVNALNGLLLISSSNKETDRYVDKFVSMPSTGFYLFLQLIPGINELINSCVNALNGLLLISSGNEDEVYEFKVAVSMPSTGFYLFLLRNERRIKMKFKCVNALNGLLLISSMQKGYMNPRTISVSMPSTGFYLFLQLDMNYMDT